MSPQLTLSIVVLLTYSVLTVTTSPPVTCVIDYGSASALLVSLTTCMQYVEDVTNITVIPISVVTKCLDQYPAAGVSNLLLLLQCVQEGTLTTTATGTPASPATPPSIVLTPNTTLTCVINTGNTTLIQSSFNECFTNISNALPPSSPISQDLQQLTQCLSSSTGLTGRIDATICVYNFLNSLNATATTSYEFVTTATYAPSSFESTMKASSVTELETSEEHTTLTAYTVPSTAPASSSELTSFDRNVTFELLSVTSASAPASSSELTSFDRNVTFELLSVTSASAPASSSELTSFDRNVTFELLSVTSLPPLSSTSLPDVTIEHSISTQKLLFVTTGSEVSETSTEGFSATAPTTAPDKDLTSVSGRTENVTISGRLSSASSETPLSVASEGAQSSYYRSTQEHVSSTEVTAEDSRSQTTQQLLVRSPSASFTDVTGHSATASTFAENTATTATSGVRHVTITAETTRLSTGEDNTNSRLPSSSVTTENSQSIAQSTSASIIKLTGSLSTTLLESSTITLSSSAPSGSTSRSEVSSIAGSGKVASNIPTTYSITTTPTTEVSVDVSPNPSSGLSAGDIAGIVVGSVLGAAVLAGAALAAVHYMRRRMYSEKYKLDNDKSKIMRQESFLSRAID